MNPGAGWGWGQGGRAHSRGLSPGKDLEGWATGLLPGSPLEIDGASRVGALNLGCYSRPSRLKRPEGPRPPGPCPRPCPRPPLQLQPASWLPWAPASVLFWVPEVRLTGSAQALGLGRYGFCLLAPVCELLPCVCPSSVARRSALVTGWPPSGLPRWRPPASQATT